MTTVSIDSFASISLEKVKVGVTDFSLGPVPKGLRDSISFIGVTHPITVLQENDQYRLVCGNRRVKIARELEFSKISAVILSQPFSDREQLRLNLFENLSHREYHDLELGQILFKLEQAGVQQYDIIDQYMPRIGLERSKKLLLDYLRIQSLILKLQCVLFDLNIPIRIFSIMFTWDEVSQRQAASVLDILQPSVNKTRELLEWIDEASSRDRRPPSEIFLMEEIRSALASEESHKRYDCVREIVFNHRFPILSELRQSVWRALDRLHLDPKIKIRTDTSFERESLRVELNIRDQKELINQIQQLSEAARTEAMKELIQIFKHEKS